MSTLIAHLRTSDREQQEELLSALTHGLGLIISAAAVAYLLTFVLTLGVWTRLAACTIYGGTLIAMYAASTALHSARRSDLKRRFQLYDHVAIYLLIAGTYTPFLAALHENHTRLFMLVFVWALAAAGIFIKVKHADRLAETSPLPCLALGWLVLAVIKPLMTVLPIGGLVLLVAGGISYSVGMIFYCHDDKRFFHAIWHLLVMAGSACHFAAVLFYIAV
jgi:hemolysin III